MAEELRQKAGKLLREYELHAQIRGGEEALRGSGNRDDNQVIGALDALRNLLDSMTDQTKEKVHGVIFRQRRDFLDKLFRMKPHLQLRVMEKQEFNEWARRCGFRPAPEIVREMDATRTEIFTTFLEMSKAEEIV